MYGSFSKEAHRIQYRGLSNQGAAVLGHSMKCLSKYPVRFNDRTFAVAQAHLEPHLGKGDIESVKDGQRLRFHPRNAEE